MNKVMLMGALTTMFVLGAGVVYAQVVGDGMKVKFDYTLTVDKEQVETTKGKQPLEYVHGKKMLIPGLETQVAGMKAGETKTITVKADDAYGPVRPEALREMELEKLPKDITPKAGMVLEMQDPEGNAYPAMIKEVKEKTFVLDFNHPLAGKDLTFDVSIVSVEPAPAEAPVAAEPKADVKAATPDVKK